MERKIALLYDPYLDTLGGGERYTLTIAQILIKNNYQVVLAWPNQKDLTDATSRFGLNLDAVEISPEHHRLFTSPVSILEKRRSLSGFDLVFFVSDGSVPFLFGKKNILHYQVPFTSVNGSTLLNQLKLLSITHLIVNSSFTKKVIDRTLHTNRSQILYPPVDTTNFTNNDSKESIILNVGRFTSPSHSKRQDILIDAFRQMVNGGLKNWKLILAGGQKNQDSVLPLLREQAHNYPIEFVVNPDFATLKKIYSRSTLYWHAAGFGVDEKINPESVEHFGITTVEAMASGVVPIVINKGGQKEIIFENSGVLVNSQEELVSETLKLIDHPKQLLTLKQNAIKRSEKFSIDNFTNHFLKLL